MAAGYEGHIVEIPAGARGLTSHKNPTRIAMQELILAESVIYEDGVLQRERGASAIDSAGISGAPLMTATLGVANKYAGEIVTITGGTPIFLEALDTEAGGAARTTFNFTTTGAAAVGNSIVLSIGGKNIPAGITASDTASNTYTNQGASVQSLATGASTALATLSALPPGGAGWMAAHVAYNLLNTAVAAAPIAEVESAAGGPAGGISTLNLPSTIAAGSTILVFILQTEYVAGLGTVTFSFSSPTIAFTEIAAITADNGDSRLHVFAASNVTACDTTTDYTIDCTVSSYFVWTIAQIDAAYIAASPTQGDNVDADASTTVGLTAATGFTEPAIEVGFIGVQAKQADNTITNGTGWTTLASTNHAAADAQIRVVYRTKYYVGTQQLTSTAIAVLASGQTITVTSTASCFMYGAAHEIDDGTSIDRQVDGSSGTTASASLSIGPTSPLTGLPECAVGVACVNDKVADCSYTDTSSFTVRSTVTDATNDTQVVVSTYNVTAVPTIIGMFDWHPTSAIQRIVTVAQDGEIYKEVSSDIDSVNLGVNWSVTGEHRPRFVPCGWKSGGSNLRELMIFNGQDAPVFLSDDGTTLTAVTVPAGPDWSGTSASALTAQLQPLNGILHQGRVWAFGNKNFPHQVYTSAPGDHSDFSAAATDEFLYSIESSIGDRLFCAAVYQGILIFWKYPRGIFWLDDTDPDNQAWKIRPKSHGLGCAPSTYAVLPLDDDVMFLSADGGFHLLSSVNSLSGTTVSSLSAKMRIDSWLRDNLNLTRLSQTVSVWYAHKHLAIWGVPKAGSTTNDLVLYFDFADVGEGGVPKFSYSYRDAPGALAMRSGTDFIERPIMGEGGKIYTLDQTTKTKDSIGDTYSARTPHIDFREVDPDLAARRKQFDWLEYVFHDDSTGDLTVVVTVDGTTVATLTYDAETARQKQRIGAQGYLLSLTESNTADTDDPRVLTRYLGVKKADDDPRT